MLSQMALLRFQILPFNYLFLQIPWVQSLGWEDPLENRKATHSSILAWRIPWTEEHCGLQSMGSQRATNTFSSRCPAQLVLGPEGRFTAVQRERLQYSCLENPVDGGAW